jgi:hypothetical protein
MMGSMRSVVIGIVVSVVIAVAALFVFTATQTPKALVNDALARDSHPLTGPIAELVLQHFSRFDPNQDDILPYTLVACDGRDGDMDRPRGYAIAARLIERGASPDRPSSNTGLAPLHEAALSDDTETMSFLLEHHADPNVHAVGKYGGLTPLGFVHLLQSRDSDDARKKTLAEMERTLFAAGGLDPQPQRPAEPAPSP